MAQTAVRRRVALVILFTLSSSRPPPRSTLFPYTTLFRSPQLDANFDEAFASLALLNILVQKVTRSEEHTSELQSQSNLVCRLLLEKKNDPSSSTMHTLPPANCAMRLPLRWQRL